MMRRMLVCLMLMAGSILNSKGISAEAEDPLDRVPDSVYVGTPHDVVARMLDLAMVTKEDLVYDLGCGDGRILVAAATRFGCRGVGFDIAAIRVRESLENVKRHRVEKLVQIERKDIFTLDLAPASVITLYLLPEMNLRLIPQFEKLKDGSRIVAHDYGIEGVVADKTITMTSKVDGVEHFIYLYTLPLKREL